VKHPVTAFVAILLPAVMLSACGASSVVISGSFPTPNIGKLPVSLAVVYDDSLQDFTYTEYSETGQEEYHIRSGESHIELFNAILPAMFEEVIRVDAIAQAAGAGVDAVFVPNIEEFQLALPAKTRLDVYEVWIKYNMRLLTAEGSPEHQSGSGHVQFALAGRHPDRLPASDLAARHPDAPRHAQHDLRAPGSKPRRAGQLDPGEAEIGDRGAEREARARGGLHQHVARTAVHHV